MEDFLNFLVQEVKNTMKSEGLYRNIFMFGNITRPDRLKPSPGRFESSEVIESCRRAAEKEKT